MTTSELDELAAETAATMATKHPDYAQLAARIAVSNLHKETPEDIVEAAETMFNHVNQRSQLWSPLISEELYTTIREVRDDVINASSLHSRRKKKEKHSLCSCCCVRF